jgi:hypothetical protein
MWRTAVALAAGKQFQPESSRRQVCVLFEIEILRFQPGLEQAEVGKLEDVAIDLHQIVRTCNLNQVLWLADNRLG